MRSFAEESGGSEKESPEKLWISLIEIVMKKESQTDHKVPFRSSKW
jgi:hypothetical protein